MSYTDRSGLTSSDLMMMRMNSCRMLNHFSGSSPVCSSVNLEENSGSTREIVFPNPQVVRAHPIYSLDSNPKVRMGSGRCFALPTNQIGALEAYSQPASPNFCLKYQTECHGNAVKEETRETGGFAPRKCSRKCASSFDINREVGGFEYDFVEPLDDKYKCSICIEVLKNPQQTECGHRFCLNCISRWLEGIGHSCPNCKEAIHEGAIYPDNFAKREIESLLIHCPNVDRQCWTIFKLKELNNHLLKDCSVARLQVSLTVCEYLRSRHPLSHVENEGFVEWLDRTVEEYLSSSSSSSSSPSSSLPPSSSPTFLTDDDDDDTRSARRVSRTYRSPPPTKLPANLGLKKRPPLSPGSELDSPSPCSTPPSSSFSSSSSSSFSSPSSTLPVGVFFQTKDVKFCA